ncbi:hypothetical protein FS837_009050 [Tulasnella sp. UAMH 9824]|nr:hypothetical protein FS837_009050 [Tulasnella sp. UAMH 9824]
MQGYVVDLLPFLKYLPAWLPGMEFKRYAARWKKEIEDIRRAAFETVKETAVRISTTAIMGSIPLPASL